MFAPNKRFGSFVDDVELFDHAFFNTAQPEAEAMDAQQRLLLEAAFEALQCSPPQTFSGTASLMQASSPALSVPCMHGSRSSPVFAVALVWLPYQCHACRRVTWIPLWHVCGAIGVDQSMIKICG